MRAWGYDVVASGGDNKPLVDEVDAVKIRATGGTFKLVYEGRSTGPLAYNASAGDSPNGAQRPLDASAPAAAP